MGVQPILSFKLSVIFVILNFEGDFDKRGDGEVRARLHKIRSTHFDDASNTVLIETNGVAPK